MDRDCDEPDGTNTSVLPVCGLTRTIPPSPSRPMNNVPSRVEVMLSGKALAPGSAIDSSSEFSAVVCVADVSNAMVMPTRARRLNEKCEFLSISIIGRRPVIHGVLPAGTSQKLRLPSAFDPTSTTALGQDLCAIRQPPLA